MVTRAPYVSSKAKRGSSTKIRNHPKTPCLQAEHWWVKYASIHLPANLQFVILFLNLLSLCFKKKTTLVQKKAKPKKKKEIDTQNNNYSRSP